MRTYVLYAIAFALIFACGADDGDDPSNDVAPGDRRQADIDFGEVQSCLLSMPIDGMALEVLDVRLPRGTPYRPEDLRCKANAIPNVAECTASAVPGTDGVVRFSLADCWVHPSKAESNRGCQTFDVYCTAGGPQ